MYLYMYKPARILQACLQLSHLAAMASIVAGSHFRSGKPSCESWLFAVAMADFRLCFVLLLTSLVVGSTTRLLLLCTPYY